MLAHGAPPLTRPPELVVSPFSYQSLGLPLMMVAAGGSSTAAALPAANVVMFVPFYVPEAITITKLWWMVGAAAGNIDCGIYDESANLIVSTGSTAVSGTNAQQTVDVSDTTIGRGRYYMAIVGDTVTTLTLYRGNPLAGIAQAFGLLEQASVTLPLSTNASPATFAKYTRAYVPHFGLQAFRTVGP